MSEQLNFKDYPWDVNVSFGSDKVIFKISSSLPVNGALICLDRNQANLLMLWLQEHLK